MKNRVLFTLLVLLAGTLPAVAPALAGGISADAGLTPPEGRWILRSQVRSMSREAPDSMSDMSMDRLMVPLVVVHGATPALTLGLRQTLDFRSMTMNGQKSETSGLGDLYVFTKYKILRVNTRSFTLGLSPVLGFEFPTGSEDISGNATNLNAGLYGSGRSGFWALDVNLDYRVNGLAGVPDTDPEPGNELGLNVAVARQIPVGNSGEISLAPVLEMTWSTTDPDELDGSDVANSGEDVFSLAPGLKFTSGDLILEGLVRIPVAQEQKGMQTEAGKMYLLGIRRMF
jgi:hypothetical protein